MRDYGTFEMEIRADGFGYLVKTSNREEFTDMQLEMVQRMLAGVPETVFDQGAYVVVDPVGRVLQAMEDVTEFAVAGHLWGGSFPSEITQAILDEPWSFTFDGADFALYVVPIADRRATAFINRDELAERAVAAGLLTWDVATPWVAGNVVPPSVMTQIASLPPEDQPEAVYKATAKFRLNRADPLMDSVRIAFNATEAQMDALFGIT